ncbi:uncharacterized protein [Typha angustifolia]|uniref:uncharacterized protein n=1 Tax=Typha angustifolia TaxID=59011 RepID=UPI003C30C326
MLCNSCLLLSLPPSSSFSSSITATKLFHLRRRSREPHRLRSPEDLPAALRHSRRTADHLVAGATGDGAFPADIGSIRRTTNSGDAYVGLFVRMLGLDNDPLDREQAVITLWKYSQGGRKCIDEIMQFPGCINLVINLLRSESSSTCEAAAGLLHTVSSVNLYRDAVAKCGAIEEISSLLCQSELTPEVKEQGLCTLWSLSINDTLRLKIAKSGLLPKFIRFLDDEEVKVKEAAGGILANLALSSCNHDIMVEAGVIPKLADLLKRKDEDSKIIRKEAKSALLELCKDEYFRTLITEEGLIRVPIVGSSAYQAVRSVTRSWPSLPDGTEIQRSQRPSRYGASELLLGLNIQDRNLTLEYAKMNAIVGRSQQQFLARIGAIEMEDGRKAESQSLSNQHYTLLHWIDGVARLVLILGLEDLSAIIRAAYSIADASISENMRISFKEAGAIRHLVQLLHHNSETVRQAVVHALDRLSLSYRVCQTIEAEGALEPLVNVLKDPNTSVVLLEKTINILSRIFDIGNDMKPKIDDKVVDQPEEIEKAPSGSHDTGGSKRSLPTSLNHERLSREVIIDSSVISTLIDILKKSSPSLQIKVASILEYLASFESYATTMTAVGIVSGLDAVFERGALNGDIDNQPELTLVETEEIGLATSAAARLLAKLLNYEQFCRSIDPMNFNVVLCRILKSNIPLRTKDWVAACLVKLESKVGSGANHGYAVDMEVTIYETIPRVVEQMSTSFSFEDKRAAVIELNRIISGGSMECTRAVAAAGGIFPLVEFLNEGSGDALEASLAILYNLSMDAENHPAIVAAGAVPVLKRLVLTEGPQWTRALHLFRTLPT